MLAPKRLERNSSLGPGRLARPLRPARRRLSISAMPLMISLRRSWPPRSTPCAWLAALAAAATALAHGVNMFRYPYYENDEAVYLSQAWSVLQGKLAPYTYWYDHAPAGWIQLAPWLKLVGLYTFGPSLNGGRVAMLLIHVLSALLLFRIIRRLTDSPMAAFVGVLLFGISPLGTYFMRRILLDNIMLLWVLASVDLLLGHRQRLWRIVASAVALAIAVLTKETAVVFVPTILAMVYVLTNRWQRRFATALWATGWFCVVSLYPLMAGLKGEMFPSGTLLGGSTPHVSLIWALGWQLSRTGNSVFDVQHSLFWHAFFRLWQLDPLRS